MSRLWLTWMYRCCWCCCCHYDRNLGETENGVDSSTGNKSANGQWDIYLDSQYDSLAGSLIIASEESDTWQEYLIRSLQILSISIPIILVEAILVLVFALMFIFGFKYSNDCPIQPLLIIYHLVGGGVGSLFWLWSTFRALRRRRQESGLEDDDDIDYDGRLDSGPGSHRLKDNGIWFMELLAFVFLLLAFVMGNYWTWSIFWPAEDMTETQPIDWCNHSLYIFTLVSLGIIDVLACFVLLFSCSFLIYARCCARVLMNESIHG